MNPAELLPKVQGGWFLYAGPIIKIQHQLENQHQFPNPNRKANESLTE